MIAKVVVNTVEQVQMLATLSVPLLLCASAFVLPPRGPRHPFRARSAPSDLLEPFCELFTGEFDNYDQALDDRRRGLFPREGGGHEHIHASLRRLAAGVPRAPGAPADEAVDDDELARALLALGGARDGDAAAAAWLARYYFDGDPARVFRLRVYTLHVAAAALEMRLWRPDGAFDARARGARHAPGAVRALLREAAGLGGGGDGAPAAGLERLDGCEVFWRARDGDGFDGAMAGGGCVVCSAPPPPAPAREIDVRDQLTLTRAGISLDDRGFDLASGRQLYGNWAGVPYAMTRVGETLRWTLGPAHRSAEQYEARMAALGGPTAPAPFLPAAGASSKAG